MTNKTRVLIWLNLLMAVGMATSVFTGQLKVTIQLFSLTLIFPASNLFFAFLTFPVTDIIADIIGNQEARLTVWVGFASQILTVAIIQICLLFPGDTAALAPFAIGGWKVLLGSTVAYFAAQFWDIWIFHRIKTRFTGEKHLWIRNNISTFSSQIINSTLFIGIVFGLEPLLVQLRLSSDTPYAVRGLP
ncbi:MAG: hypothetical protein BECKG1743D_GA0114223_110041 [Candidatus Kentron sp. G]|nr:MAG: hypothetical protein BECKG1743F_GA0114225_109751 [Candidatus Kentron sp. G]VFN05112.1 MAG: hypothetical protein BECKG1743E_GA0114224_108223 [Candidatus Kentron sp. G]VFN07195.1 MAG: hypothetical protein BECKG1743D_GA0114223_110041 [Candidatus Kentron sp. G]